MRVLYQAASPLRMAVRPGTIRRGLSHCSNYEKAAPLRSRTFRIPNGRRLLSTDTFASPEAVESSRTYVEAAVSACSDLISSIHLVTHTPWYITIPLVALGVNLLIRLPSSVLTQKVINRRAPLAPLLQAWGTRHQKDIMREATQPKDLQMELGKRQSRTIKRLYRDWGAQTWKMHTSVLGLPVWMLVLESLRRMSGAPKGLLLGTIFGRDRVASSTPGVESAAADSTSLEAQAPQGPVWSQDLVTGSLDSSSYDINTASDAVVSTASSTVESLATGGCLWFTDLTAADPLHILPFVLSALLVNFVVPKNPQLRRVVLGLDSRHDASSTQGKLRVSKWVVPLNRSLLIASALVGPVTMSFPAAMHLYWISSVAWSSATMGVVSRLMRKQTPDITPCAGREVPFIRPPPPSSPSGDVYDQKGATIR